MTAKEMAVRIYRAVYETIVEAGEMGAPCGVLYLALSEKGMSLDNYQRVERGLLATGMVRKEHDCLIAVRKS